MHQKLSIWEFSMQPVTNLMIKWHSCFSDTDLKCAGNHTPTFPCATKTPLMLLCTREHMSTGKSYHRPLWTYHTHEWVTVLHHITYVQHMKVKKKKKNIFPSNHTTVKLWCVSQCMLYFVQPQSYLNLCQEASFPVITVILLYVQQIT